MKRKIESMTCRRFYARFALTAFACVLTIALSQAVQASGGARSMKGSSEWKVARIDAPKGQNDGTYCAMTRKFGKDVVLTLGARTGGDTSLAFDFQKKTFDLKKEYVVALASGSDLKKAFSVRPASPAALVLAAGSDAMLVDAFEKNGKFDVSIDGKVYVFDLGAFGPARRRLGDCVAGLSGKEKIGRAHV